VPFGIVRTASTYLITRKKHQIIENNFFNVKATNSTSLPVISLKRLDKLGRGIIVWNVEPKPMRNGSWSTLAKTKGVPTNKISTITVWVIQGIEMLKGSEGS
jgi:hypothetical protein